MDQKASEVNVLRYNLIKITLFSNFPLLYKTEVNEWKYLNILNGGLRECVRIKVTALFNHSFKAYIVSTTLFGPDMHWRHRSWSPRISTLLKEYFRSKGTFKYLSICHIL